MKQIIFFIILFVSLSVNAEDKFILSQIYQQEKCSGEEDSFIRKLENELTTCQVQMPDGASTTDMDEAYYQVGDCSITIADKIFKRFYKKSYKQTKDNFDKLVESIYASSHDISQHSDFARIRGGSIYNTEAIAEAVFHIRDVVKKYLHQIRNECDDKIGFDFRDI